MEVISKRQARLFAIILAVDGILVSLPNQIITLAGVDTWLAYVIAMFGILLMIGVMARIRSRFPGQDLLSALTGRYPVIGRVIGLFVVLFFFIMLIRDIRTLTEFVTITLLPSTPLAMIAMLVVFAIVVTARGGLEVVARMTELWLPLMIAMLVAVPFLLFPEFEIKHLQPVFDRGLLPPLQGSWFALAYMGQLLILPFLLPTESFGFKDGLIGLAIATGLILWTHTYMLLSMGVNLAGKMLFPLYETVRLIRVTDFLDRFDLPFLLVYLPLMITKVALLNYAVAHGVKRLVPALSTKSMLGSLGAFCFVCSFWFFRNGLEVFSFARTFSVLAFMCEFALPMLLFLLLRAKKSPEGEGAGAAGKPAAPPPQGQAQAEQQGQAQGAKQQSQAQAEQQDQAQAEQQGQAQAEQQQGQAQGAEQQGQAQAKQQQGQAQAEQQQGQAQGAKQQPAKQDKSAPPPPQHTAKPMPGLLIEEQPSP